MSSIALRPTKPSDIATPSAGYKATFLNLDDNNNLYQKDEFGVLKKLIGDPLIYKHTQNVASTTWLIPHGLDTYPSITVVDSAGTRVYGDERFIDANNIELTFSAPFGGIAYLTYGKQ